jgi:hypothetical protein
VAGGGAGAGWGGRGGDDACELDAGESHEGVSLRFVRGWSRRETASTSAEPIVQRDAAEAHRIADIATTFAYLFVGDSPNYSKLESVRYCAD